MITGKRFNPKGLFYGALVPNWLLKRKELNGCAKLVYGRLYQYCNEDGLAYPKLETLADEIGFSVSGIKKAIAELESAGLIEVEDHFAAHDASDYFFLWHEWAEEATRVPARPRQPQSSSRASHKVALATATLGTSRQPQSSSPLNESGNIDHGKESFNEDDPSGASLEIQKTEVPDPTPTRNESKVPPTVELEIQRAIAARKLPKLETLSEGVSEATREKLFKKKAKAGVSAERRREAAAVKRRQAAEMGFESETPSEPEKTPRSQILQIWREEMGKHFPDYARKTFVQKEWGNVQNLLDNWDLDQVEIGAMYLIRNWSAVTKRLLKSGATTPCPTVGFLCSFGPTIIPQAQAWYKHKDTLEEYKKYGRYDDKPRELSDRYVQACKELEALGLNL